jgi:hypothetical protein
MPGADRGGSTKCVGVSAEFAAVSAWVGVSSAIDRMAPTIEVIVGKDESRGMGYGKSEGDDSE